MDKQTLRTGWIQAFISILVLLGLNQAMGRYSASILNVHPILYSCTAFASCAFALLAYSGPGKLAKETMRSIDTWVYGIILMFSYIIGMLLFSYVSATQGSLLQKVGVLLTVIFSWLFFDRKPDSFQNIGIILVISAIIVLTYNLESENKGLIFILGLSYGIFQAIRLSLINSNRVFNLVKKSQRNQNKINARVIGIIMLMVSLLFFILSLVGATAQILQINKIPLIPEFQDFINPMTIIAGIIHGLVVVAPSVLIEFSSTNIIKSENFAAVSSLSFIATIFWENVAALFTPINVSAISSYDIFAGVLVTTGGLLIALTRKIKKESIHDYLTKDLQNIETVEDTQKIIASSLEHFNYDINKTSEALEIPVDVINAIYNDKQEGLCLKSKFLAPVARNYREKVAHADSLTGLLNKRGFMIELKAAALESNNLSLFFLDLNKFKPINDTYGHKTGDYVLKEVAKRLEKIFPKSAFITRLGGDEFCILLIDTNKTIAQHYINKIHAVIEQDIKLEENNVNVATSIGLSSFPEDTNNPEMLLEIADQSMYKDKSER